MNMLDEIQTLLRQNGITTEIYKGKMPELPDGAIALYEYAGRPPEFTHDEIAYENPGLQVVARDKTYAAARQRIQEVFDILKRRRNEFIGEHRYLSITAAQSPFPLGTDTLDRQRFAVNFNVARGE